MLHREPELMDDSLRIDWLEQVAMEVEIKIHSGRDGYELTIGQVAQAAKAADLRSLIDRAMEATA